MRERSKPHLPAPGRRTALAGAALALALAGPLPARAATAAGMGADAERARAVLARHELRTLDGTPLAPATLRGEVVVLNVWASWCAPCRDELPRLDALHGEIRQKGGRVVAVSIDHERRNVERFVRKHELALPVCHDGPDGLARLLDLRHVPYTLVLDRDGAVAFTTTGADRRALDELAAVTRRLLAARPALAGDPEGETR